jgi:L-malate glycosyltransferase
MTVKRLFFGDTSVPQRYTVIVPALDMTGPVNVAVDLAREASRRGWLVALLYLTEGGTRKDTQFAHSIRKFKASDLFRLRGIVHTHCLRPDILGWLISWNRRCVMVTTLHNFLKLDISFDYRPWQVWLAWNLWRKALRRYDHVVCISNAMKRYYERMMPWRSFELARNFRDPANAPLPASIQDWVAQQRAHGRIVLAYAGSLSSRKNIHALVDAVTRIDHISLLVCGSGPEAAALSARSRYDALGGRLHLAGQLPSVAAAISIADALVLPSFAEGFPLVVIEAASTGRPTLMSNIAVHRELAQLGFGSTFNHRTFANFETRIDALLKIHPAPDAALQTLWRNEYTSKAGFTRYEAIFDSGTDTGNALSA